MTNQGEGPASSSRSRRPADAPLVLTVEDDPGQQLVLRSMLEARGLQVVVAGSGREALQVLSVQDPQLITLDLGLPDFDGVELCRRIRQLQRCPIIVVSADGDETQMVNALDVGADDYVTKPFRPELLMARVRVALRHAMALASVVDTADDATFVVGDLRADVGAHLVTAGGRPLDLSPRQFRLLTALMRNAGRVLTHKQLTMTSALDEADLVTGGTLRGAMSHLRKRIGTGEQRPRIVTEPHVGYRMVGPD